MKELSINITKAQLVSFDIKLEEGKPVVNATIALLTEGGKAITTYGVYTDGWNDENKFDLPIEALPLIGDLARILEGVVVRHCRDGQKAIGAANPESQPTAVAEIIEPEIEDILEPGMLPGAAAA